MHRLATPAALCATLLFFALTLGSAHAQSYGYGPLPSGSYQQSCTNVWMNGSTLTASCSNNSGQLVRSSLDVNGCRGDIANINGQLRCNGYNSGGNYYGYGRPRDRDQDDDRNRDDGYGNSGNYYGNGYGYLPSGSYQNSCTNASMNGSTLRADCRANSGAFVSSRLNVRRCVNADIANLNGRLRCIRRY